MQSVSKLAVLSWLLCSPAQPRRLAGSRACVAHTVLALQPCSCGETEMGKDVLMEALARTLMQCHPGN